MAEHADSYNRDKMIEYLLADIHENASSSPRSRIECTVGKYKKDDKSELHCRQLAESIAKLALSPDFNRRVKDLRACLFPQLFACCCRLMIDDLMKLLPAPDCPEAVRGGDDLANFAAFLWRFIIIPELMTNGDASYCTGPSLSNGSSRSAMFVKVFTSQLYGEIGVNDATEWKYIIEKLPNQIEMHSHMIEIQTIQSYEAATRGKFANVKKNLLENDCSILMEFVATLDARCVLALQSCMAKRSFLTFALKRSGSSVRPHRARVGHRVRRGKYAAQAD